MAELPPIVQEFRADQDHLIRFARIVEKHFGALADDLELLRSGQVPDVEVTVPPHGTGADGRIRQAPDAWCETCPRCYAAFAGCDRAEAVIALLDHYAAEHR